MAEAQSAAFFSADMDALGQMDAEEWNAMSEKQRQELRGRVARG